MVITTVMAILFIILLLLELLGFFHNSYFGLLLFVVIPAAFVLGLLLIPGLWLEECRLRSGVARQPGWPVIDLSVARQRWTVAIVAVLT